jgi:HlyD family secretion protein
MQTVRRIAVLVVGVLLVLAVIVQARRVSDEKGQRGIARATAERADAAGTAVRAEGWVVTYPGAEVTVGTDVAGTVVRLLVKEKDKVRKGQLIAELRADDTRAALAESRSQVEQSQADARLAEVEISRAQQLYDARVGTKQALDRATRDRDAAQARTDTARATVRRLEAMLDKTRIYAPINGVVLSRLAQPGESVKDGAALVSLADLNRTRIEAEVDEFDVGRVALGSEVTIRAEGYDGQHWQGRVEEIPDAVVGRRLKPQDPTKPIDTRVLLVKIAFAASTPLKLGQRVQIELKTARGDVPSPTEAQSRHSAGDNTATSRKQSR